MNDFSRFTIPGIFILWDLFLKNPTLFYALLRLFTLKPHLLPLFSYCPLAHLVLVYNLKICDTILNNNKLSFTGLPGTISRQQFHPTRPEIPLTASTNFLSLQRKQESLQNGHRPFEIIIYKVKFVLINRE